MALSTSPSMALTLFIFIFTLIISTATSTTTTAACTTCNSIKSNPDCNSNGYINYIQIYHCNFPQFPQLAFTLLLLWLLIIFYTLTNTSSEYFCPAVQNFSTSLNLSPAIAGTTLLALGSGSLDVFSSIIAFTSATTATGDTGTGAGGGVIGLNSVLGGGIFLCTVVVGVLSLAVTFLRKTVVIDKPSFIRDIVFLFLTLISLVIIIVIGKINLFASLLFVSIYIFYILLVSYMHFNFIKKHNTILEFDHLDDVRVPLPVSTDEEAAEKDVHCQEHEDVVVPYNQERCMNLIFYVIKLPVYLPRRLTIPVITKERWSKPVLVISMVLAPIMVGVILDTKVGDLGFEARFVTYFVVGLVGIGLGSLTFAFTSSTMPPQKGLVLWHASGFIMSVTWTYVTCNELVSLLESLGKIIGVSPSIIGLTILAWGNSFGDLVGNLALAIYGGLDGSQIAMAECYAEPLFCVVIGIGLAFVFVSWSSYPAPYVIPDDPDLCETVGFFMIALLWALVILLKRNMRLDRTLGCGLLVIYFCFLFIKIARALKLLDVSSYSFVHSL